MKKISFMMGLVLAIALLGFNIPVNAAPAVTNISVTPGVVTSGDIVTITFNGETGHAAEDGTSGDSQYLMMVLDEGYNLKFYGQPTEIALGSYRTDFLIDAYRYENFQYNFGKPWRIGMTSSVAYQFIGEFAMVSVEDMWFYDKLLEGVGGGGIDTATVNALIDAKLVAINEALSKPGASGISRYNK